MNNFQSSQFNFFTKEWPAVKELINKVEVNANNNPEFSLSFIVTLNSPDNQIVDKRFCCF